MRRSKRRAGPRLLGPAILLAVSPAWADDIGLGRDVARQCAVCHGIDGIARVPDAPHIGGESVGYLERQLEAFRSGERVHPQMSVIAQGLSDDDIANVAAYYAAIVIEVVSVPE